VSEPVHPAQLLFTDKHPLTASLNMAFEVPSKGELWVHVAAPASFADCTLLPDPGYDPDIRYVCFNPKGVLASGDPDPEFNLSFRVRIR